MTDTPRPKKPPTDPRLAEIWQATPTSERYWLDDEHHVLVRGRIVPLAAAAKRQEAAGAAS